MASTHTTRLRLYVDWARNGSYTDESDRLVSASGVWRRNNPEDSITSPRGIVQQATITLLNQDLRYSTINELSPLAEFITEGGYYQVPMYLLLDEDEGDDVGRIFTGVIKGPKESGGTIQGIGTTSFDCRGREELLLQRKLSTLQSDVKAYSEAAYTEAGIILRWLDKAGMIADFNDPVEFVHDPGNFSIPWAWLDDESPLEDIWQLAAAGGGVFYTNQNGTFVYESYTGWLDNLESANYEAFTDGDYRSASVRINDDELYETIICNVNARQVAGVAVVWESPEQVSIPINSTNQKVVATLQQPLYELDDIQFKATSAGGLDMTANIGWGTTSGYTAYAQRIEFLFSNSAINHAAQIRNFKIVGKSLTGGQVAQVKVESDEDFWTNRSGRTRQVDNQYIQSQAQAESLANFLLDRHELPRAFYVLNDCPGKRNRYMGMRIVIRAGNLVRSDRPALVTGISWSWNETGGFTQTLEAFDCLNLFPYAPTNILATGRQANNFYFRLNVNTLGSTISPDPADHRVFY